jgi:membrane-associated phospholipid phosphatase
MVKKQKDNTAIKEVFQSARFFSLLLSVIYVVALTVFCIMYNIIPGPEVIFLIFLIYAAYNKRSWHFFKQWLPLITVFISYQLMYSLVGTIAQNNLHTGPYELELQLFGQIPSVFLQQNFRFEFLDYTGAVFYSLHFFAPTIFAYILWQLTPQNYKKYTIAFALCTYSALITFLFYSVAPPWLEANLQSSGILRVLTDSVDKSIGIPVYRTIYSFLSPNLYAAFPSLHSALPTLIALFAIKIWRKKALPILIFPFAVWFSAVYLGEHYVVDVLGGIAYAVIAFISVEKILPWLSTRFSFLRKNMPNWKPNIKTVAGNTCEEEKGCC